MELKEAFKDIIPLRQWCLVNQGKQGRAVEINPITGQWEQVYQDNGNFKGISPSQPREYWLNYEDAKEAIKVLGKQNNYQYHNIGLIIYKPLAFIDIDDCIDDKGILSNFAQSILDQFKNTYVELSKSGKGLHIYCLFNGETFNPRNSQNNQGNLVPKGNYLEIYTRNKVAVITGKPYGDIKPITDCTQEVLALDHEYFPPREIPTTSLASGSSCAVEVFQDDKRIKAYIEKAVNNELETLGALGVNSGRHCRLFSSVRQLAKLAHYMTPSEIEDIRQAFERVYMETEPTQQRLNDFNSSFKDAWELGASQPRTINLFDYSNYKKPVSKPVTRLKVISSPDKDTVNSNLGLYQCFLFKCLGASRDNTTLESMAKYFSIDTETIINRVNLAYYNGFEFEDISAQSGIIVPVYTCNQILAGFQIYDTMEGNSMRLGSDCSAWFSGASDDVVIITENIEQALILYKDLYRYCSVIAVGSGIDGDTYSALTKAKKIIAVGSSAFCKEAANSFKNLIPFSLELANVVSFEEAEAKGIKIYKYLEACLSNKLEIPLGDEFYIHPSGEIYKDYSEYISAVNREIELGF